MKAENFKTSCQEEREARDKTIYAEYKEIMSVAGRSKTMVIEHLMNKHNIHSRCTIYNILRRVEKKLKNGGTL